MTDSQGPPPNPLAPAPYRPIACERYSEYEVAILHHEKLHLRWSKDNVIFDQIVIPLDHVPAKPLGQEKETSLLLSFDDAGELSKLQAASDHIQAWAQANCGL